MDLTQVIQRPVITEKTTNEVKKNRYAFVVDLKASKKDIKKAIEKAFDVHIVSLSTMIVKGRSKRVGKKRIEKKLGAFKKAIATIKDGEKIGLFVEGAENK